MRWSSESECTEQWNTIARQPKEPTLRLVGMMVVCFCIEAQLWGTGVE